MKCFTVHDEGKSPFQVAIEHQHSHLWSFFGISSASHTDSAFAAQKTDGSVGVWGDQNKGGDCSKVQAQLVVDVHSIYSTTAAFAALKTGGSVVTWGHGLYGGDCSEVQPQLVDVRYIYAAERAFA